MAQEGQPAGVEGGGPAVDPGPLGAPNLVVTVAFSLLLLYPFWRIFWRAGFPPWYALLVLIPYVGLPAAAALLALRPWPAGQSRRFRPLWLR